MSAFRRVAFLSFDHQGIIHEASEAAAGLVGRTASLVGADYWSLTAPGQKQREINQLMRQPGLPYEKEFLDAAGKPLTVRARGEQRDEGFAVIFEVSSTSSDGSSKEDVERNLRKQNALLLELGRSEAIDSGDLDAALKQITETAAAGIGCSRSSVWLFAEGDTRIDCLDLFQKVDGSHGGKGASLFSRDFPGYFEALRADRTISCDDAHTHPATREFSQVYLTPLGITSMLEAPIRHQGRLIGVLCNEHQGPIRSFTQEEQNFSATVADFVSRALEASARAKFERELKAANAELEQRVALRTRELARRNADMQRVFDNVNQGFITLDRSGGMSSERSRILESWFGAPFADDTFSSWLGRTDDTFGAWFPTCFEALGDGFMPIDVSIDQLPRQLVAGRTRQTWRCSYQPLMAGDTLDGVLVIITDVTAELERQRAERDQQELMHLFTRVLADKPGVASFMAELDGLIRSLQSPEGRAMPDAARTVHTIKGNASLFQLGSLAELCHDFESAMADEGRGPTEAEARLLLERWSVVKARFERLLGSGSTRIEIDREEYDALVAALEQNDFAQAAQLVKSFLLPHVPTRLARVADQAKSLARRLGRGEIDVRIATDVHRFDEAVLGDFWASFSHVVRNAVDHGLERPEERARSGKPATGQLWLTVSRRGSQLVVTLADDGRGIDFDALAARARQRGLPHATRAELEAAMFTDGITTRDAVSDVSGRGIGMSAVLQATRAAGGVISVDSERGRGTSLTFTLKS